MKKIYSYSNYLILNESRNEIIGTNDMSLSISDVLNKYANWYNPLEIKTKLFRKVDRVNYDKYILTKPTEKRKYIKPNYTSDGTPIGDNYMNLIVDNEWLNVPSRSNALMGSVNKPLYTSHYGDMVYRVIPILTNSKIAIATKDDFWFTFDLREAASELGVPDNISFRNISTKELGNLISTNINLKLNYDNLSDFKSDLSTNNLLEEISESDNRVDELKNIEYKYGSIYNFLRYYISPNNAINYKREKDSIKVLPYNINTIIDNSHIFEFWANSTCLLIKEDWGELGSLNDVYLSNLSNI